uniref:Uncharacterized protein n=1 Tax=Cannabis sativa TaxID=3483 RepID=A0A803PXK4_CANSA
MMKLTNSFSCSLSAMHDSATPVTVGKNGSCGWSRRVLKANTLEPRSHYHCSTSVKKCTRAVCARPIASVKKLLELI